MQKERTAVPTEPQLDNALESFDEGKLLKWDINEHWSNIASSILLTSSFTSKEMKPDIWDAAFPAMTYTKKISEEQPC